MKPLPDLARDGILTKSFWGQVKSIINANFREVTLQPGVGYTLKNSPGGASLVVGGKGGSSAPAAQQSFDVVMGSDENGTPTATIVPGTVNGILPSNIFDTFTLDTTSVWYFKATATTDGKIVTAVELNVDSSPPDTQTPVPQAMPAAFDKLFAMVKDGKVFRMIPDGSITVGAQSLFVADRESWTPGKPMTETWYAWGV